MTVTKKLREAAASLVDELFDEAEGEVCGERVESAKVRIKAKLKQLQLAKQAVANIEREIDDLKHELKEWL